MTISVVERPGTVHTSRRRTGLEEEHARDKERGGGGLLARLG